MLLGKDTISLCNSCHGVKEQAQRTLLRQLRAWVCFFFSFRTYFLWWHQCTHGARTPCPALMTSPSVAPVTPAAPEAPTRPHPSTPLHTTSSEPLSGRSVRRERLAAGPKRVTGKASRSISTKHKAFRGSACTSQSRQAAETTNP